MNATNERPDDISHDFEITRIARQPAGGAGTWVSGRISGHRFDALVFAAHAADPEWELAGSRISKLWVQRLADGQTVFNWDRGADVPAATETAQAIVDFLSAGLADHLFA